MNFNADTAKSLSTALLTALAEGRRLVYLIDLVLRLYAILFWYRHHKNPAFSVPPSIPLPIRLRFSP